MSKVTAAASKISPAAGFWPAALRADRLVRAAGAHTASLLINSHDDIALPSSRMQLVEPYN
jgi:hypothetical protein